MVCRSRYTLTLTEPRLLEPMDGLILPEGRALPLRGAAFTIVLTNITTHSLRTFWKGSVISSKICLPKRAALSPVRLVKRSKVWQQACGGMCGIRHRRHPQVRRLALYIPEQRLHNGRLSV
jgi:hypothetical protein